MTTDHENIRLFSFRVKNYTVFEDSKEIKLNGITVLTGKNNVGKSSALSALYILLNQYQSQITEYTHIIRYPRTRNEVALELKFQLTHSDSLVQSITEHIKRAESEVPEPYMSKCRELLAALNDKEILISGEITYPRTSNSHLQTVSVCGFSTGAGMSCDLPSVVYNIVKPIMSLLYHAIAVLRTKIFYLGSHRVASSEEWMRLSFENDRLLSDAQNLKPFLNRLFSSGSDKVTLIKNHIKSAFPEICDIITPTESLATLGRGSDTTPLTDIRFKFKYYNPEKGIQAISLKHCGTGLEQYLAIVTAIVVAEEPQLFLIDEPHSFLHPFAEKKLLELMFEHPQHQYIIATHSPLMLNSVPPESIRLLKRNEDDGSVFCSDYDINETISELGLAPSDLWFYEKVLFVEGPTEEAILPIILHKVFSELNLNKIKIADLNGQASALRGSRKKKMMHEMLKVAIDAVNPFREEFAIDYIVLLDKEKQNDTEIETLKLLCSGKIIFTDQHEIENYLLDPEAIYEALTEECEYRRVKIPDWGEVRERFKEVETLHEKGSVVLKELFESYGLCYEKTKHGPRIASQIDSDHFQEFKKKLEKFIK